MSDVTAEPATEPIKVRRKRRKALRSLLTPLILGLVGIPVGVTLGLYMQPEYVLYWTIGTTSIGFLIGIAPSMLPYLKTLVWSLAMLAIPSGSLAAIFGELHYSYVLKHRELLPGDPFKSAIAGGILGFIYWCIGYAADR